MTFALVLASAIGVIWAWIVWIVVGGIAGAIADKIIQGNKLGILGNILVGVITALTTGKMTISYASPGDAVPADITHPALFKPKPVNPETLRELLVEVAAGRPLLSPPCSA